MYSITGTTLDIRQGKDNRLLCYVQKIQCCPAAETL